MSLIQWSSSTYLRNGSATPSPANPVAPAGHAHSRFLYVVEQGVVVRRARERIRIMRKKELVREVPAMKLQGVLCLGNVQVSTQCLRTMLDEGIWVSFFTSQGRYLGRLQPPAESGGRLRACQWRRALDPEFTLRFARAVVDGKIRAARQVASGFAKHNLAETLGEGARLLRDSLSQCAEAASLETLRGVEGAAARAYFDLFRRWNRSPIPFEGREKRGATTPINALLNLGYSLLLQELNGLIEAAGLDPAAGFYHQADGDRPSLACDWMEEFRHLIVDRLVLRLVNRGAIGLADFDDLDERGLRLKPDALRKYLTAWEKTLLGSETEAGEPGQAPAWRGVFLEGLAQLVDCVREGSPFESYSARSREGG